MRGMTKADCLRFERLAEKEITKVLGAPEVGPLGNASWYFPYGDGGKVSIHLLRSKQKIGERGYLSPWLACRYHNPANRGSDGYTLPQSEINWPSGYFTYPSGKCNLHIQRGDNFEFELATHLLRISKSGTPQRDAFELIRFEVTEHAA